jgi:hypothetical protein
MFHVFRSNSFRHQFLETASYYRSFFGWRFFRRIFTMLVIFSMIASIILIGIRGSEVSEGLFPTSLSSRQVTCASMKQRGRQDIWNEAKAKYSRLADDKFT